MNALTVVEKLLTVLHEIDVNWVAIGRVIEDKIAVLLDQVLHKIEIISKYAKCYFVYY